MNLVFKRIKKEDSTWKVVYMDMMTVLMTMFLCFWVLGSVSSNKGRGNTQTPQKAELAADEYFATGKSTLTPKGLENLTKTIKASKLNFGYDSERENRALLKITGFTDPTGKKGENFSLGFNRAQEILRQIEKQYPNMSEHTVLCSGADNIGPSQVKVDKSILVKDPQIYIKENSLYRRLDLESIFILSEGADLGD